MNLSYKTKKILLILILLIISMAVEIILSPIRGLDFKYSSCIGFIVFFFLFTYIKKKINHILSLEQIFFSLYAGYLLLDLPIRLFKFRECLVSFPDVIMQSSGILCAYITFRFLINKKSKYMPFLIGISICIFMFVKGYSLFIHKLNHGTFTGSVHMKCTLPLTFETPQGEQIILNKKEGYVLLYFWNVHCGACIRSFPDLQKFYEEKPDNIQIFMVYWGKNSRFPKRAADLVSKYNFPTIIATTSTTQFQINGIPTIFLIDLKNEQVIFEGDLEYAKKYIQTL